MKKNLSSFVLVLCLLVLTNCETKHDTITASNETDTSRVNIHKPNIYIYPTQTIELDIFLSFPKGGEIVESIPVYGDGWNVSVDTNGLIDNEFHYLFYECEVPDLFQKKNGWIVDQVNLESFFRENLNETGFIKSEIDDFIDYWIPILNYASQFVIYSQSDIQISPLIKLTFSENPDSILRYFYLIEENTRGISFIEEPSISEFKRQGFTVVEWGVINH